MTTVMRVSEPRELLAMVPFRLGFAPRDSLVLMSLRGPRHRLGLVMRMDLADSAAQPQAAARMLTGHLLRDGAAQAVAVLYSDHDDPAGADAPSLLPVTDAVRAAVAEVGIELLDVWHVGPSVYRSLTCSRRCCPAQGRPVTDLQSTVVGARMVLEGCSVAADREAAMPDLQPAPADRRAAVERDAVRRRPPDALTAGPGRRAGWRGRAMRTWRAEVARVAAAAPLLVGPAGADAPDVADGGVEHADDVAVAEAGLLLAALDDLVVRDAVMLACVPDAGREPERFCASGRPTDRTDTLFARVFTPFRAVQPDGAQVTAARQVLQSLARQATGRRAAAPLALLAWLAWWSGNGPVADRYATLALDADRQHRLAILLRESLERGVGPGWVSVGQVADQLPETIELAELSELWELPAFPEPGPVERSGAAEQGNTGHPPGDDV